MKHIRTSAAERSSGVFWAYLAPEPWLRNVQYLSAAVAAIVGFALIMGMPLHGLLRAILAVVFVGSTGRQLRRLATMARAVNRIRANHLGELAVADRAGRWQRVRLLPGSMVLNRLVWLRMRMPDGRIHGELLVGNAVQGAEWHRFQLIWQHCRQNFGDQDRN